MSAASRRRRCKTNLEAADEAARQLRLRDLAGLIVIDFIDMESRRNVAAVERRLKEALKHDRARIQVGSISHFGLLEMSRQRLRPSLAETNFVTCPHCSGTGHVRSTESAALHVLRAIEEEGGKRRAAEIVVHCAGSIALYILNHKRLRLAEIEQRHGLGVVVRGRRASAAADDPDRAGAGAGAIRPAAAGLAAGAAGAVRGSGRARGGAADEVEEDEAAEAPPPARPRRSATAPGSPAPPASRRPARGRGSGSRSRRWPMRRRRCRAKRSQWPSRR